HECERRHREDDERAVDGGVAERNPKDRVGQRAAVVVEPKERPSADQAPVVDAQVKQEAPCEEREGTEQQHVRSDEQVPGPLLAQRRKERAAHAAGQRRRALLAGHRRHPYALAFAQKSSTIFWSSLFASASACLTGFFPRTAAWKCGAVATLPSCQK